MSNGSKNRVYLIGNIGKEPELHTFADGSLKAAFSLATSESWKDEAGKKVEKTTWHDIVVYGGAAKIARDYVHKGDKVALEASLEKRDFEDRSGVKRTVCEVVVRPYNGEITLLSPKP